MSNQRPNAIEITGNMSPNFWKFNNVSPNGVFGNKVYGDDLKRIWEFVAMVVVHGGESGGDMVVSGGLKGCLDHWIQGSSPLLPPLQRL
ncbi:hypothetical protein Tco_0750985 [Tanacetum coccineum]|uniref:Uncharacterized protein n=1 Tax=Tanacetum coccineum TaxID=301880 RepID=A0ABQ4Z2T0_9ASTR